MKRVRKSEICYKGSLYLPTSEDSECRPTSIISRVCCFVTFKAVEAPYPPAPDRNFQGASIAYCRQSQKILPMYKCRTAKIPENKTHTHSHTHIARLARTNRASRSKMSQEVKRSKSRMDVCRSNHTTTIPAPTNTYAQHPLLYLLLDCISHVDGIKIRGLTCTYPCQYGPNGVSPCRIRASKD